MNHLQGLKIKVVSPWPSLTGIYKRDNTMEYMTNQMLQRFTSNMANVLSVLNINRIDNENEIQRIKETQQYLDELPGWYDLRDYYTKQYIKYSSVQSLVKKVISGKIRMTPGILQKMEKIVTEWIFTAQIDVDFAHQDYLENRHDVCSGHYSNRHKHIKKKLAKLVALQQAIRKQKQITTF